MKAKRLKELLLRQHDIGRWWGGFRTVASNTSMYITLFNMALLVPMAYVTWVAPWFLEREIVFPFGIFIGVIFFGGMSILLIEYKLLTPSGFSFWNDQWWRHNNPIKKKMNKMDRRLKAIEEAIRRLDKN